MGRGHLRLGALVAALVYAPLALAAPPRNLGRPPRMGESGRVVEAPHEISTAADAVDRYHGRLVDHMAQYRGAPMGVADYTAPDVTPQDALHFVIRRVPLDDGGYAADGVYWGLPQDTLWHAAATVDGAVVVSRWFRAPSYAHAAFYIRAEFPKTTTQRVSS